MAAAPNSCEKRRFELNATGSLRGRVQGAGAARACFYSAEDLQHQGTCYTVCMYGGGAGGPSGEAILHYLCASGAQGGNLRRRRPPQNALNSRANCSARLYPISPAARCRRHRQHRRHLRPDQPRRRAQLLPAVISVLYHAPHSPVPRSPPRVHGSRPAAARELEGRSPERGKK
jgi:hypothetical protein